MSRTLIRLLTLLVAALSVTVTTVVAPSAEAVTSPRSYETAGPYAVTVAQGGPDHTLYYPSDIAASDRQHPVIIWGNGTGATPAEYDVQLRRLASWGFVVAAANTTQSGSGQEMLAGARFLIAEDQRAGSIFQGHIDETHVGAAGHSQGGGGAIAAGADPIVDTVVPLMPGPQGQVGALHGPVFYLAGQLDYIVPSFYVQGRYAATTQVPAVFGELKGADHFFPGATRDRAIGAVTAWFRFWLMGDEAARSVFFGSGCGMCTDTAAWSRYQRNAKAAAIAG
jgi:pimeloyl-ACP methyl ester carboxylesterase